MGNDIQILEKPEWVSWDEIHEVLWRAHAQNRESGIAMAYPSLPGDEIRKRIEGHGKMFIAFCDGHVVATSAVIDKTTSCWCGNGHYAYFCFASVLPDYAGRGVYKQMYLHRERECREMGLDRILFDTHEKNSRIIDINRKNGFIPVDYKYYGNHFNIVMVKWLSGCPYPSAYCHYQFYKRRIVRRLIHSLKSLLRRH